MPPTPEHPVALGIDIGTGSTKAGLVDPDGRLVAVARAPHPIDEPGPGRSETDPARWLDSVTAAVVDVLATAGDRSVVAVGLSGQMHGVVVTDADGRPLRPAILWSDGRAHRHLPALTAALDREGATGALANPVVAGMAGPSLAALGREEPAIAAATVRALQPKDWVRHQLTAVAATEPTDASATLLWDAEVDDWSPAACRAFGVDQAWLPPVVASGAVAGSIVPAWADRLGIPADIPVAAGAADTAAALLGAGVALGETQVSTGTGGQIATLIDRFRPDRTARTHLYRAATTTPEGGARWYAMAAMQNVGIAVDWAAALLDADGNEIDRVMTASTDQTPGGVRFRPSLTGERTPHMDATLTASFDGLRSGTGRAEIIRSVFDGVGGAMADGLAALVDAGHPITEAVLAGGGSTAGWWRALLADALGIPLIPHDAVDASVRGAGLLGWAAVGHRPDPAAAVHRGPAVLPASAGSS
ncbi:MAG: FGGY family carbohydrate kinase [Actinomycetota bacterium]